MNLITDPWIPVIRQNQQPDVIVPWQIAEIDNPVIEIAAPRPDFQGALYQFLIGLLQTAFAPEDEEQWEDYWQEPPEANELKAHFLELSKVFELVDMGEGAFMQDHCSTKNHAEDFEKAELLPIEDLMGGALSGNTRKENKDLFVKSGSLQLISPYWAALALFNMQVTGVLAWGQHRVGLRGNAPLTTLLISDALGHNTLWKKVWLNIIYKEDVDLVPGDINKSQLSDIFPWLRATRVSPNKEATSPSDAHPLQSYWPLPRRIKLKIEYFQEPVTCDLSGQKILYGVRYYQRATDGVYYTNGWVHPLTPYTRSAKDQFPKPIEGRLAGEGLRQWVVLNYDEYSDEKNKKMRWGRALNVKHFYEQKPKLNLTIKLWSFGYDASNASVRCWYESIMPTLNLSVNSVEAIKSHTSKIWQIAYQLEEELTYSLIRAWFRPQTDSNGKQSWSHIKSGIKKTGHLSTYKRIEDEYWQALDAYFPKVIEQLVAFDLTAGQPFDTYWLWLKKIQSHCLKYFDENALNEAAESNDIKRVINAKNYLLSVLYPKKNGLIKDIIEYGKQKEARR